MGAIKLATSNSTDEEYGGTFATEATDVAYDNTTSGLTADNTQEAIDDLAIQTRNMTYSSGGTYADYVNAIYTFLYSLYQDGVSLNKLRRAIIIEGSTEYVITGLNFNSQRLELFASLGGFLYTIGKNGNNARFTRFSLETGTYRDYTGDTITVNINLTILF